jgi:hypothetical protein
MLLASLSFLEVSCFESRKSPACCEIGHPQTQNTPMFGPTSPTTGHYHRQSAIALNNAAVSLLVRGYFHEAAATLCDALKITRSAPHHRTCETNTTSNSPIETNTTRNEDIHQATARSDQRIALCTGAIATRHEQPRSAELIFRAISSQDNPAQALELITSHDHCPSAQVAFPMTIDHIESSEQMEDDLLFEAATILYNYGIALGCMGTAAETSVPGKSGRTSLDGKAHRVFQITHMLLCKKHGGGERLNPTQYLAADGCFLLLRTVVLYSLVDVSINLHLHEQYDEYKRQLLHVLHAINVLQTLIPYQGHCTAAAA